MKRILCFLIAATMMIGTLCACSSNASESSTVSTGESSTASLNSYDEKYLEWKAGNWAQASDDDKTECAKTYLGYMGDLIGLKVTSADYDNISSTVEDLDTIFNNEYELNLKEIILYGLSDPVSSTESSAE